ncbi:MAG: AraC family transcriptional regulator ligand-binding domain-containing protein [Pseudomonas sp.]|uniref:helix-turn-helix transcriptional regulator n=1 Tax=unclassified Pseudomonas TaxID=196821 RepID=UPI000730A700|nr:AraC family transcriptional regulator [Pseudomonas sp. L5B5]KTC35117.1 AraC family transcriptional regulator [Pseudomonas sp. ABAC61]UCZ83877.1 AraC family transcriptional regulator [Pseudomonas sp. L5B5]
MTHWIVAPTIPARFARELLAQLRLDPGAQAALLQRSGLSPQVLRDGQRIAPLHYRALSRLAVGSGHDEAFGFFARPVPLGSFAQLLRLLVHLPSLADAFEEAARFYRLFDGSRPWRLEQDGNIARLVLMPRTAVQADSTLWSHMLLLTLWHTGSWLAGQTLPLRQVVLPEGLASFAPQTRFLFGRQPRCGTVALLELPAVNLRAPIMRRPQEVPRFVRQLLPTLIAPGPAASFEAHLRGLLGAARPFAGLSEIEAAQALGMSRQTLARKLAELGTTFLGIRDDLRRDLACSLLARGATSVADLAHLLGYSEPSAFQRAFKQWTGLPPGAYRGGRRMVNSDDQSPSHPTPEIT